MKNVFRVTIHYHGDTSAEVNVIATDDVKARATALIEDARSFKDGNLKAPKVEYCEVALVCEAAYA